MQDDMSILATLTGWRADDFASTTAAATASRRIERQPGVSAASDVDLWKFTTAGGGVNLQLAGPQFGGNLDAVLSSRTPRGRRSPPQPQHVAFGASISRRRQRTYFVAVRSGGYGNAGQCTPAVRCRPSRRSPQHVAEIADVRQRANGHGDRERDDDRWHGRFANVHRHQRRQRHARSYAQFHGDVGRLLAASNLTDLSLTAGQSTSFTIRFNATAAGSFAGNRRSQQRCERSGV
jgi:hypothetical protein